MADNTNIALVRIENKVDTLNNWESNNPQLLNGEIAYVTDSDSNIAFKLGDGTNYFKALPFAYKSDDYKIRELYTLALNSNGDEYIINNYSGTETDIIMPSFYKGVKITEIAANAFYSTTHTIKSIVLPKYLTTIGDTQFSTSKIIEKLYIPSTLSTIGSTNIKPLHIYMDKWDTNKSGGIWADIFDDATIHIDSDTFKHISNASNMFSTRFTNIPSDSVMGIYNENRYYGVGEHVIYIDPDNLVSGIYKRISSTDIETVAGDKNIPPTDTSYWEVVFLFGSQNGNNDSVSGGIDTSEAISMQLFFTDNYNNALVNTIDTSNVVIATDMFRKNKGLDSVSVKLPNVLLANYCFAESEINTITMRDESFHKATNCQAMFHSMNLTSIPTNQVDELNTDGLLCLGSCTNGSYLFYGSTFPIKDRTIKFYPYDGSPSTSAQCDLSYAFAFTNLIHSEGNSALTLQLNGGTIAKSMFANATISDSISITNAEMITDASNMFYNTVIDDTATVTLNGLCVDIDLRYITNPAIVSEMLSSFKSSTTEDIATVIINSSIEEAVSADIPSGWTVEYKSI